MNMRLALVLLAACGGGQDDTAPGTTETLQWYLDCGDPVCQGYTGPFDGVPLCESEQAGDACTDGGTQCDPQNDCNALLVCTDSDPTQQPGGCPISQRAHKVDIRYLSPAEVDALGRAVDDIPLATWRYTWAVEGDQLGFVIGDPGTAPAVRAGGEHVDLYAYTSMAVAALQAQSREIEALRAEVATLRQQMDARDDATCAP